MRQPLDLKIERSDTMRRIFILVLCSVLFRFGQSQDNVLPRPTGNYFIGVTYLSFVDEGRKEIFDSTQESNREITVKAWYPSDRQSDFEPY